MLRKYEVGKVSVVPGSHQVVGFGTSWLTYVRPGNTLVIGEDSAQVSEVLNVATLTLTAPWTGPEGQQVSYYIEI